MLRFNGTLQWKFKLEEIASSALSPILQDAMDFQRRYARDLPLCHRLLHKVSDDLELQKKEFYVSLSSVTLKRQ
jgi:hypothetical protein